MHAHVLLYLSNKVKKRDKMRGYAEFLLIFCNKFN